MSGFLPTVVAMTIMAAGHSGDSKTASLCFYKDAWLLTVASESHLWIVLCIHAVEGSAHVRSLLPLLYSPFAKQT